MIASIDNYTTQGYNPISASIFKNPRIKPSQSSTVIGYESHFGINFRIQILISEFSLLQDNWDEDNAKAPEKFAIFFAKSITSLLEKHGQQIFHAAPGPNGEIMLDIRNERKTKSIEIIFYGTHSTIVYFPESGKPMQKNFELEDMRNHLEWLNK